MYVPWCKWTLYSVHLPCALTDFLHTGDNLWRPSHGAVQVIATQNSAGMTAARQYYGCAAQSDLVYHDNSPKVLCFGPGCRFPRHGRPVL